MSFPNHITGKARVELGRKWGRQSASKRKPAQLDLETVVWRAKQDRKGRVIAEGHDYRSGKTRHWLIRHSVSGDVDQVDLMINGERWKTGSLASARFALKWGFWKTPHLTRKPDLAHSPHNVFGR